MVIEFSRDAERDIVGVVAFRSEDSASRLNEEWL